MKKNKTNRKLYKSPEIEKIPPLIEEKNSQTGIKGGAGGPGQNNNDPVHDGYFKQQPNLPKKRIKVARRLISAGTFLQSLAVTVMRPDDLVEFSRASYSQENVVQNWSSEQFVDQGLSLQETELLRQITTSGRRILVLGAGGGREALVFAGKGYEVTAVDFIPEMLVALKGHADRLGVKVTTRVAEISAFNAPADSFDIIWLSSYMYSCIPSRRKRVKFLERIRSFLTAGGVFACQVAWSPEKHGNPFQDRLRKVFAMLSCGNTQYQPGDTLWFQREFLHLFSSVQEIESELKSGGFSIGWYQIPRPPIMNAEFLLHKS